MFARLPGVGGRQQVAAPADEWRPVTPVPDDAPPGPPQHKRRGNPSGCWTYRNAAGKPLGYVLRFNLPVRTRELAAVARLLGEDVTGLSEHQAAQKAVDAVIRLRRLFLYVSAVSMRCTMSWSVPKAAMLPRVAPISAEKTV